MATFTVNLVETRGHSQHIFITVTTGGGRTLKIVTTRDEIRAELAETSVLERALTRMVSAVLEAGVTTPAAIKTALEGRTFRV